MSSAENKPRVDFYLLETANTDARYNTLYRFVAKAYQQQHRVYIHCADQNEAILIDKLLWTFQDTSFLPHQLLDNNVVAPIVIGYTSTITINDPDILLNLSLTPPDFYLQFKRVVEIISTDPAMRAQARENFRFYRTQNCEINSHHLS